MTLLDGRGLPRALFGSAVSRHQNYTGWDAAIRSPLATSRRIGFVSLDAGAGSTTLAQQTLRIVAERRDRPPLAIDVSGAPHGLGDRLGIPFTEQNDTRSGARTSADAVVGLDARNGWFGLRPSGTDPVAAWLAEAAPVTRFFDIAISDFGVRHPLVDLAGCAALCDVLCIVSDSRRAAAEVARAVAPAVADLPERTLPVIALVDHSHTGPSVARLMVDDRAPVLAIPHDPGLRDGMHPRTLAARAALLALAATLVSGAVAQEGEVPA